MYIKQLVLKAWGTLTDCSLDLSESPGGLVVIHGENGAGKTTALTGLRSLFFGIPRDTPDNHVHRRGDLRIAGTVVSTEGVETTVVRKKGNAGKTLLDDEGALISEEVLRPFLGGLDREAHARTFALDHESLRRGGDQLSRGDDTLAASLFGASLGADVHEVRKTLQKEAESLFKGRGQVQKLNAALKTLEDRAKEQREAQVKSADWTEAQRALVEAEEEAREAREELGRLDAQILALERTLILAPALGTLKELAREREELGEVVALSPDARSRREEAERTCRDGGPARETHAARLARLDSDLKDLELPGEVLAQAAEITELYEQIRVQEQDLAEAQRMDGEHQAQLRDAGRAVAELGWSCEVGEAKERLPEDRAVRRLRGLVADRPGLVDRVRTVRDGIATLEQDREELEARLEGLDDTRDLTALEAALHEVQEHGGVGAQVAEAETDLQVLADRVTAQLASHGPFVGDGVELVSLAVPSVEVIQAHVVRAEALADRRRELERRIEEIVEQQRTRAERRSDLERQGAVATEEQLRDARRHRGAGWALVKGALGGHRNSEEEGTYAAGGSLETAYEAAVSSADDVADVLRTEAERSAKFEQLSHEQATAGQRLTALTEELERCSHDEEVEAEVWAAVWAPARLEPGEPAAMGSWRLRHETLVEQVLRLMETERRRDALVTTQEALRTRLERALSAGDAADQSASAEGRSLAEVRLLAEQRVDRNREQGNERTQILREQPRQERRAGEAARELREAEEALESWEKGWVEAIAEVHFPEGTEPGELEVLLDAVTRLSAVAEKAAHDGARRDKHDRATKEYADRVTELAAALGFEGDGLSPTAVARALHGQLSEARTGTERAESLRERRQQEQEDLDALERKLEGARADLEALTEAAGCADPSELALAEQRWDQLQELKKQESNSRRTVAGAAAGKSVEELIADASEGEELEEVQAELSRCKAARQLVSERSDGAQKRVGTASSELRAFEEQGGLGKAAIAASSAEAARARGFELREEFLRKHLAAAVLEMAIDRFRAKHQGPLVSRGSELFRALTLGVFSGLDTGFNDKDQQVLFCERAEGPKVTTDQISDGERDLLYLALRIASLEHFFREGDPIPLVVDDVLIQLDDKRSAAALEAFAELAKTTQVLVFTHHNAVRDLAKEVVPPEDLRIVEL